MARKLQIASFLLGTLFMLQLSGCYYHRHHHHHHHDDDRYAPGMNQHYNH